MTTLATTVPDEVSATREHRFRLNRAGILNVWQYDDQVFQLADGRLLLRGANGAGKSKTLEMLLPFVLDGDKARMTASARHHTSLLWLMTDGYDGQARVGYLWVEFARTTEAGQEEFLTCGVGIRATASSRSATAWFFTTRRRVGSELALEDEAGPLSRPRLVEALAGTGQVFEQARAYKEHVGRTLFGLELEQYDEVLRLLYWLRQPQIGEDIEPARLAGQLLQALPQLDDQAVRTAGDTFDELAAVGEQLDRRSAAAGALEVLSDAYVAYARAVGADRAEGLLAAHREQARRRSDLRRAEDHRAAVSEERRALEEASQAAVGELEDCRTRLRTLQDSPEARSQRRLTDLAERVGELEETATTARGTFAEADQRLQSRQQRLDRDRQDLLDRVRSHVEATRVADQELDRLAPPAVLASAGLAATGALDDLDAMGRLARGLDGFPDLVGAARGQLGQRQAALAAVRASLADVRAAERDSADQDRRAAEAETRWERATGAAADAEQTVDALTVELAGRLRTWASRSSVPSWQVPETLTVEVLERLPADVRAAAEPALDELRGLQQKAALARDTAAAEIEGLVRRRDAIEAETDPAPPEPALPRTARPDGAPLWRLVDFGPGLAQGARAGVEAALQASGLLDAWVRPDGRLLDAEQRDTVLAPGAAAAGPNLADLLVVDVPPGCDIEAEVVAAVLAQVAVPSTPGGSGEAPGNRTGEGAGTPVVDAVGADPAVVGGAWVRTDGSWALGPLRGHAAKEKAQYVGATARADERRRRLAEVETALGLARGRHDEAAGELERLEDRILDVQGWLRDLPPVQPLLRAWATLDERRTAEAQEEREHLQAQESAQEARRRLAGRRHELRRLAEQHGVPDEEQPLSALEERLRSLVADLGRLETAAPVLRRDLGRLQQDLEVLSGEAEHVTSLGETATAAEGRASQARAELEELESAVGADVAELRRRLGELQTAIAGLERRLTDHRGRQRELDQSEGRAEEAARVAQERVAETDRAVSDAAARFAELSDVPGLLAASGGADEPVDATPLVAARSLSAGDPLPGALIATARELAGASGDVTECFNRVYKAHAEASTGPAADHEPRLLSFGELLALVGRDDGGEHPITVLSARVTAGVERDRHLLTERERNQFEQHILGELGDAIRRRRLEAEELVTAMNRLLHQVSTSQGIRVRLHWHLRDDVPPEAREAVRLLTEPVGALLPEERATLRDSLHRLIAVSRAEQPELSYAEHLALALDYRRWFAFRIRYTRPEAEGRWLDLHRRSPLSQGEQKVLCYLPLFAAAAAHFSSLAGAAPHAPRLVLLDDAFPKIDVRTHPLLFGLLVQLDLDFVITSERLWGDHPTVPSLAIYEALRDPAQRGIAQYEFRWDGRALQAMT